LAENKRKLRRGVIDLSDILISGYYGFKNSGDDALLLAITQDLKKYKKDVDLAVLSRAPRETAEVYKVKAVNRMNPFAVIFNIISCRMLLSGGGTLIQDGTSTKSLLYYLAIIKMAHLFGKKIMLYSNGIGPLREEHREMTKKVLNKADIITLRDPASKAELEMLGVDKPRIILTADPAFDLECRRPQEGAEILKELGLREEDKFVCISVRKWKGTGKNFCIEIAKTADYLVEKYGYKILFLPMQPAKDYEISQEIRKLMKNDSVCIDKQADIDTVLSVIGRADLCIGMRLHSLIYAAGCAVPVIGLVYDVKIAGFMDYINQKYYLDAETIRCEDLKEMADECILNIEKIKLEIEDNLEELKKKAELNAEYAIELLKREGKAR
jgi:polysaccharide pyruvyl transferase CsaB